MKSLSEIETNMNDIFKTQLTESDYKNYIMLILSSNNDYINDILSILDALSIYYRKYNSVKQELISFKTMLTTTNNKSNVSSKLKQIISLIKEKNENLKKNKNNQRGMSNFKQSIYLFEVNLIIKYLIDNFENNEIFENFISILLYVAKKRKIIEILKLNENYEIFGLLRKETKYIRNSSGRIINEIIFRSSIKASRGDHLINELATGRNIWTNKRNSLSPNNHAFKYNNIKLTSFNVTPWTNEKNRCNAKWIHTKAIYIYPLLLKLNKLYDRFITSNVKSKRLLSKLYWLYMQTCPFERGSASIGEIIFSALLQKYFGCNFKIYEEEVRPEIIPDIHALSYDLKRFQDIFWERFTTCPINKRNNNNQNQNVPNNFFDN